MNKPTFIRWLLDKDIDGDRGVQNIWNASLVPVSLVSGILSVCLRSDAPNIASKVGIPAASLLIGLSFAWAGRSTSLFQDKSFSKFIIEHGAPIEGYIYSFQLAIVAVLVFLFSCFIITSGGVVPSSGSDVFDNRVNLFFIIILATIAFRECWGVINFVNRLTLQYYEIREREISAEE